MFVSRRWFWRFTNGKNPLEIAERYGGLGCGPKSPLDPARRGFTNFRTELDGKLPNRPCSVSVRLYRQALKNAREKIYFFAGYEQLPEISGEFA
jgi:hypothetical protein